ncbi:MAG: PHP domain-containing protein [Patescibacteria group bacterium]
MYPYDLHCHSDYSDGDYNVTTVFERAKKAGLKGVVLTDHNSIGHFDQAISEAARLGLWTCQGIEITSQHQGIDIHILGYSKKFEGGLLAEAIEPIRKGYEQRAIKIVEKLKRHTDYTIDFNKLLKRRQGKLVTRYNIVQELMTRHDLDLKEAQKLIGRSGPAWLPYGDWVPKPQQVVDLIHRAGGIAVLGHPGDVKRSSHNTEQVKEIVVSLVKQLTVGGLDGLEVRHSSHSKSDVTHFIELAKSHNLAITGGSDWHGEIHHPEISLGQTGLVEDEFTGFLTYLDKKAGHNVVAS